jgi:hypothetical protein
MQFCHFADVSKSGLIAIRTNENAPALCTVQPMDTRINAFFAAGGTPFRMHFCVSMRYTKRVCVAKVSFESL